MDIQDCPDRLIICVHHPTNDEMTGMDLFNALQSRQVSFAELDATTIDEYILFGRGVSDVQKINSP
jgi:hypothetical protein